MQFLLVDFEGYSSQHVAGARKISVRTKRPQLLEDPIDIKMEQALYNYDLFFDEGGLLLYSVHFDKHQRYKITYGYNHKKELMGIMCVSSKTNVLLAISEFHYDKSGRIKTEQARSYHFGENEEESVVVHVHQYAASSEKITVREGQDSYHIQIKYDENGRIIEDKSIQKEGLLWWYKKEYDDSGELRKEVFLNKKGEPEVTYLFIPSQHGLEKGYKLQSKGRNYKREYEYVFNKKGHWVSRAMLDDGDPKYFYERKISYY